MFPQVTYFDSFSFFVFNFLHRVTLNEFTGCSRVATDFSCLLPPSSIFLHVQQKKKRHGKKVRGFNPFAVCHGFWNLPLFFLQKTLLCTLENFKHYWSSRPNIFADPPKFRKKSGFFKSGFKNSVRQTCDSVDHFKVGRWKKPGKNHYKKGRG